jgi:hypothetical protein
MSTLQPTNRVNHRRALLWLLLVLAVVTLIRIRLLDMPLERDEGEFAYGGQLLLQGISPYQAAYNDALKLPGTCAAYAAAIALFGQTTAAIHLAVLLVTLASALLVFLLTRRMCGDSAGAVASATYAMLAINPMAFGLAAHATHFVLLPALAGIFLLQNLDERTKPARILFAGLLLGLALMMKQTGAVFGIFAAAWIVYQEFYSPEKNLRRLAVRLGWLTLGGLLPFFLTCVLILLEGDWPQFWLWTFEFASAHAHVITFTKSLQTAAGMFFQLFMAAPGLWCVALAGLALLFQEPKPWRFFVSAFFFFSLAAVYPAWRGHYFIQLFPALGMLAGVAWQASLPLLARLEISFSPQMILFPIFFVAIASPLLQWNGIYFTLAPAQASRAIYGTNPFPEAVEIGQYVASHSTPDDRVAVLGSEPEIYFYSRRRAATGYIDTYPLMEPQPYAIQMQQQMIREIESAKPKFCIFVHVPGSWLQYSDSKTLIFDWFGKYHQQLRLVGLVEIPVDGPTTYRWFGGVQTNVQTSADFWIAIYQRP